MTQVTISPLAAADRLAPFTAALAAACRSARLTAGDSPGPAGAIWLGLQPGDAGDWQVAAWAPASAGPGFALAATLHGALGEWLARDPAASAAVRAQAGPIHAVWPAGAPAPAPGRPQAVLALPSANALVSGNAATAFGTALAKAIAAGLALAAGTAAPPREQAQAAAPPAARRPAQQAVPPGPRPPGGKRPAQGREGRAGSRTYQHPPWPVTQLLDRQSPASVLPPA